MGIIERFIQNNIRIWLVILLLGVGGIIALLNISRLEDPAFTIKTAVVVTQYPGASAQQVEEEVTLPLENALQRLPYLDNVTSISSVGLSQITVNIDARYQASELPQIWDELRRRVGDAARQFPPGVSEPFVNDDFGDVYGYYFVLYGDNYNNQELRDYAEQLRRELILVPGVGKVAIGGVIPQQIHLDISHAKMAAFGITPARLADILSRQNIVSDAGSITVGSESIRLHPTGEFQNLDDLGNLLISAPGSTGSVYLRDIATLSSGVSDSPDNIYHANGHPALAMGISYVPGVNVINVGEALSQQLSRMESQKPAGIQLKVFYDQAQEVKQSVDGFILNFLMALAIVIGTLLIFMGLKSGVIIAASLAINVLGTLLIMYLAGIELQRVSLGALIIALSMLVDNAIVVVEGVLVDRQRGNKLMKSITHVIKRSALPLLGATIIAILAFAPIGLSQDSTGEYCKSLFQVLLISLMLSWLTALTLTPVFIKWAFRKAEQTPQSTPQSGSPYDGKLFRGYRRLLNALLRHKTLTLTTLVALLALSLYGFGQVRQNFFPSSNTPIFFVDLWMPYGTDIHYTSKIASEIEQRINQQQGVAATVTTVGQGGMRFTLTYNGQRQYTNYAQIMVRTDDQQRIASLSREIEQDIQANYPEVNERIKHIMFGPSGDSAIEVRIRGSEPDELRHIASQVGEIIQREGRVFTVRNDWQERSKIIRPQFSPYLGRELGVDKREIDNALRMNFSGTPVGIYREGSRLMPMLLRTPDAERLDASHIANIQVWSQTQNQFIPLSNVVSEFTTEWEDPLIMRRDRMRILTVQTDPDPLSGETSGDVLARIRPHIEALKLPAGYSIEWGGDEENSREAQAGLFSTLPIGFLVMFIITVLMFSSLKNAAAIWLTVPLALIGVTVGFLLTGIPFGFMALIGLLSLSGMLIRNGIVLVDEINQQRVSKSQHEAIIDAATSRLRPILLTAFTTVLGLAPLLRDVFFQSMAVVIMFGLGFATVLTLLVLPVIYQCFHLRAGKTR
ncbi:efflux RND transporter permease subunit [Winslowiella iniecta]|uniref:Multidrug transporter AcrB n=1 Tax=Winslowiella iniecta TaxID=1560201 RepID=A0A0L7T2V5_9GAMM|nr:efflux RND transporter permease subunit [Winslowiella iniecta]KOC89566.1 multidrug transporter AcrB [Winslowiella iniecta]KOC93880.1 multidrug transporter AcrB [Winslowiella iniecta]